jgi:branched-chain amino acid transport system permease protein
MEKNTKEKETMSLPQLIFFGIDIVKFTIDFINFFALYLAISLTLNIEFGYTGIPNFGKVLYIAGGATFAGSIAGRVAAYLLGIQIRGDFITYVPQIINTVNNELSSNWVVAVSILIIGLAVGAVIGAILGYISSFPAIRLREDYLGMLLLAVAQFYQIFLRGFGPLVGGTQGIPVPDPFFYFSTLGLGVRDVVGAAVLAVAALLIFIYAERIARSPLGRTLRAIRDNEDAARALGKDDVSFRRSVLVVASALSGIIGALYTFYIGAVGADTWTRYAWTFWPWLIVIIGGAGNNVGTVLGSLVFAAMTKVLQQSQNFIQPYIPFDVNWLQYLLFAGVLILVLLLRPEGIIREKPTPTLPRKVISILSSKREENKEKV